MRKEKIVLRRFKMLSAGTLASVIAFGGIGVMPTAQAAEPSAFSSADVSLSYLSDPIRIDLIHLNNMKDDVLMQTESSNYSPDAYRYYDLLEIRNKAYTLTMDPTASQAELLALKQQYQNALHEYIDYYIRDVDISRFFSILSKQFRNLKEIGIPLTAAEQLQEKAIEKAWDYVEQLGGGLVKGNYVRAYKESYLPDSIQAAELYIYEPSKYRELTSQYRADIQARLNSLSGTTANHTASVQAFEQAASLLDQLAASGSAYTQVEMAKGNLEIKYKTLVEELKRNSPIENSDNK